jgi:hypothetical protein
MSQLSSKNSGTLQGLSITPLLVLVMGTNRFDLLKQADITLLVGCTEIVSLLGFFSFLQTAKQISSLAEGIGKMQEGKIDALHGPVHK